MRVERRGVNAGNRQAYGRWEIDTRIVNIAL